MSNLTQEFTTNLQANFPGTISTLLRIGDKIQSATFDEQKKRDNDLGVCLLCSSLIEKPVGCSAYNARLISRIVSTAGPNRCNPNIEQESLLEVDQQMLSACCSASVPNASECSSKTCCKENVANSCDLCYGCRIVMQEVDNPQLLLPLSQQEDILHKLRRQRMRLSVEQFLL